MPTAESVLVPAAWLRAFNAAWGATARQKFPLVTALLARAAKCREEKTLLSASEVRSVVGAVRDLTKSNDLYLTGTTQVYFGELCDLCRKEAEPASAPMSSLSESASTATAAVEPKPTLSIRFLTPPAIATAAEPESATKSEPVVIGMKQETAKFILDALGSVVQQITWSGREDYRFLSDLWGRTIKDSQELVRMTRSEVTKLCGILEFYTPKASAENKEVLWRRYKQLRGLLDGKAKSI